MQFRRSDGRTDGRSLPPELKSARADNNLRETSYVAGMDATECPTFVSMPRGNGDVRLSEAQIVSGGVFKMVRPWCPVHRNL
jgi:hypothetical protein